MQEKLTDEQKKLVEENYNLIYGFCALHKIDKDEYSDILSLALCESAMKYDATKQTSFSSYAYSLMDKRMKNEHRNAMCSSRVPKNLILSESDFLSDNYNNNVHDNINSLFDIIESTDNTEEIVMYKCMLNDIKSQSKLLSDKQKQILDCLLLGLTNKEMHLILNCTLRYTEKLRHITKDKVGKFILSNYEV